MCCLLTCLPIDNLGAWRHHGNIWPDIDHWNYRVSSGNNPWATIWFGCDVCSLTQGGTNSCFKEPRGAFLSSLCWASNTVHSFEACALILFQMNLGASIRDDSFLLTFLTVRILMRGCPPLKVKVNQFLYCYTKNQHRAWSSVRCCERCPSWFSCLTAITTRDSSLFKPHSDSPLLTL